MRWTKSFLQLPRILNYSKHRSPTLKCRPTAKNDRTLRWWLTENLNGELQICHRQWHNALKVSQTVSSWRQRTLEQCPLNDWLHGTVASRGSNRTQVQPRVSGGPNGAGPTPDSKAEPVILSFVRRISRIPSICTPWISNFIYLCGVYLEFHPFVRRISQILPIRLSKFWK